MTTVKLILKGILLYASILFWIFFVTGADSIMEQHEVWKFLIIGGIDAILLMLFITEDDVDILTFNKPLKH